MVKIAEETFVEIKQMKPDERWKLLELLYDYYYNVELHLSAQDQEGEY